MDFIDIYIKTQYKQYNFWNKIIFYYLKYINIRKYEIFIFIKFYIFIKNNKHIRSY